MVAENSFKNDLPALPIEWSWVPIGQCLDFKNGLNKAKHFFGYGKPIINYMDVFLKPIITEKTSQESEMNSLYTFMVDKSFNKIQIKSAVESYYGVSVERVRTMNYGPERKIKYTKNGMQKSKSNSFKKAIVKLIEGDSIDFYENNK